MAHAEMAMSTHVITGTTRPLCRGRRAHIGNVAIEYRRYGLRVDHFDSADGTRLAYRRRGQGRPLICLPGGPMQASSYLGDLGGLSAHGQMVLLDLRGTGSSAIPADPASYRCDRQVDDVEALRLHLGLDEVDLVGHSAGAAIAVLYAIRHPDRVRRLVLINPSPRVVGIEVTASDRRKAAEGRREEPWFPDAFAALERILAGTATAADGDAITPFMYGRWDAATQAYSVASDSQRNDQAAATYYSAGTPSPDVVRSGLTHVKAPVLLVTGEYDIQLPPPCAAEYAKLFQHADVTVLPRGGHFAWKDAPERLGRALTSFLW